MAESVILGLENAARESGVTVRKNYTTATPSEQSGYPATNALGELIGAPTRGAAADVGYTTHLIRLAGDRLVCGGAIIGHNISPQGQVRITADAESCRPWWIADGVDDEVVTAEAIPVSADLTVFARLYLPPTGIDNESTAIRLMRLINTGQGTIVTVFVLAASSGAAAFKLLVRVNNFSTAVDAMSDDVHRGFVDLVYRNRASDDAFSLSINGSIVASGTASASIAGTEDDYRVELFHTATSHMPARINSWAIYDRYFSDTEAHAYPYRILDGSERGLLHGVNFTEGSGATAADVTGAADMTLTGGSWADMAHPSPSASTGVIEAIGQWYRRQALRISEGTSVVSPSLGTAPRDLTMSFIGELPDDFPAGTNTEVLVIGPSVANAEISLSVDADGQLVLLSNRGTPDTVTSATIRDAGVIRGRTTLKSVDSTSSDLSLYLGTGTAAEALVGTVQVGPYDAAANCLLRVGTNFMGTDNSHLKVGFVRYFGAVRLEADDDLLGPCNLADPSIIECLSFEGDTVTSMVVPARSYTVSGDIYEPIAHPNPTRLAPGRDGLGFPRTGGIQDQIDRVVWKIDAGDVEVPELFVEIWDPLNPDGYVEIGAILVWSSFRPRLNRVHGAPRSYRKPLSERMPSGHPMLQDGYSADGVAVRLKYLDHLATDEQLSEADELARRLQRLRSDLLVLVVWDPQAPQWLLQDRSVIGTVAKVRDIEDTDNFYADTEIQFEGVL